MYPTDMKIYLCQHAVSPVEVQLQAKQAAVALTVEKQLMLSDSQAGGEWGGVQTVALVKKSITSLRDTWDQMKKVDPLFLQLKELEEIVRLAQTLNSLCAFSRVH